MERSTILSIAKSRLTIAEPGKYMVKVTSVNHDYVDGNGVARQIVNLAAMRADRAAELKAAIRNGTATEDSLKNTLAFNVLNGKPTPEKGARIYVYVDLVNSKRENRLVLGVTGWEPVPVAKAVSFNWDDEPVGEDEKTSTGLDDVFNG